MDIVGYKTVYQLFVVIWHSNFTNETKSKKDDSQL